MLPLVQMIGYGTKTERLHGLPSAWIVRRRAGPQTVDKLLDLVALRADIGASPPLTTSETVVEIGLLPHVLESKHEFYNIVFDMFHMVD